MVDVSTIRATVNALALAEPPVILLALWAFLRSKDHLRFPTLRTFLIFRLLSILMLTLLLNSYRFGVERHLVYATFFYAYWAMYLVGAVLIFFVIQEMFKHVMAPLPGITRLGLIAFRWAATISLIVAVASGLLPAGFKGRMIMAVSMEFMRSVSVMELCLLALLAFSVHSLGLSFRSRAFGVGLGFGVMALADFMNSVFTLGHKSLASPANAVAGVVSLLVLMAWTGHFLVPQGERKPLTLPANSALMRWNEIAVALGHASPQVVVGTSSQFFLQDVEGVVDKMLTKNAMNIAN